MNEIKTHRKKPRKEGFARFAFEVSQTMQVNLQLPLQKSEPIKFRV